MNKSRRERLKLARTMPESAEAQVERALDDEIDSLDNLPMNLQDSDKAAKMESAIDNLEEAINNIENAIENINEASV